MVKRFAAVEHGRRPRCSTGLGRIRRIFAVPARALLLVLASNGLLCAQAPGPYRIDPERSRVEIHLFREGLLGGLGDNHLILVSRFSGTAEESPRNSWKVHVVAESKSLVVTDPGASASTRQEVQRTMLGPSQLDVARYPTIELRSVSLTPAATEKSWRMLTDVSLHGVTRQVEFPLNWSETGERMHVWGKKNLLLRNFKIEPIRKFLGSIKVRNEFELVYDIILQRTKSKSAGGAAGGGGSIDLAVLASRLRAAWLGLESEIRLGGFVWDVAW